MTPQSTSVPSAPIAPAVPPRRRKRWRIVLVCLLLVLAVPAGGYLYVTWSDGNDLDAAFAEIERTDPRWRFDDIQADRPAVPDAENPAIVMGKLHALLGPLQYDIGEAGWRLFDDLPAERQLNGPQVEALRGASIKHVEAIKIARGLESFQREGRFAITYKPDYFTTNIEPLQRCRGVMSLLQHDAMLRAQDGDADGALQSCRAGLVAARSIGEASFLIAALIRFAGDAIMVNTLERVLAQGEPSEAELASLQALIAQEIAAPILLHATRGERAGCDRFIAGLGLQSVPFSTIVGGSGSWDAWLLDRFPLILTHGRPEYLRLMTRTVEATKLPPEGQAPALREIDKDARASRAIVVRQLMPAITKVAEANRRTQANLRCALAGIAAERYRLKHDRWPAKLADLVKEGLLDAVPVDPIDGQPLSYKVLLGGVVVYSIGLDGIDNGGNVNRDHPQDPGTDLGVRLWGPDARRQPPLPPVLPQGGSPQ